MNDKPEKQQLLGAITVVGLYRSGLFFFLRAKPEAAEKSKSTPMLAPGALQKLYPNVGT